MSFVRRNWYYLGLLVGVCVAIWLAVGWGEMSWTQKLLALNVIVLVLHQFEEYAWPGGFPWICNEVLLRNEAGPPDRYILNRNSAAFVNVLGWAFYLIPALLPEILFLGIGQVLFGLVGQFVVHGVVINRGLKTWYNPGLAAVVLGHIPLGVLYFSHILELGPVQWWDWALGILYLGFFAGVIMQRIAFGLLADPGSPYPFSTAEMNRNDRTGKLRRAGIAPRSF